MDNTKSDKSDKSNKENEWVECFECREEMTKEDIIHFVKDNKKLCNECRFFPDCENWPPNGY
jgi:acetyl-CoA carboxylase beta subunit